MNKKSYMNERIITNIVYHEKYDINDEKSFFDIAVGLFKDIPLGD